MKVCIEALGCHSLPLESGKHKEQCELTSHHGSVLSTLQRTICDNASPGPCSLGSGSEHGLQQGLISQGLCWGREKLKGQSSPPDFAPPSYRATGEHFRLGPTCGGWSVLSRCVASFSHKVGSDWWVSMWKNTAHSLNRWLACEKELISTWEHK